MEKYLILAVLASVLVLSSCSTPPMAVESNFKQQAEILPIEGRSVFKPNGNFTIGEFKIADVHRGWKKSGGFNILGYENIKSSQKYEFSLNDADGAEPWYVFGASKIQQKNLKSLNGISIRLAPNREYYLSNFNSPESGLWHLLTIDPGSYLEKNKFEGEISNGKQKFRVTPVYKFQGKTLPLSGILGYEFIAGDEIIGAVQVVNEGMIWMKPGLPRDTRKILASAAASLLLYQKLNEDDSDLN